MPLDDKTINMLAEVAERMKRLEAEGRGHLTIEELTAAVFRHPDDPEVQARDYQRIDTHLGECSLCRNLIQGEKAENPLVTMYYEIGPEAYKAELIRMIEELRY